MNEIYEKSKEGFYKFIAKGHDSKISKWVVSIVMSIAAYPIFFLSLFYNTRKSMVLTRENIHMTKTSRGGFTHAQILFLGFNPKEKWINKAIGMELSDAEYSLFKMYSFIDSGDLKYLKKEEIFKPLKEEKHADVTEEKLFLYLLENRQNPTLL